MSVYMDRDKIEFVNFSVDVSTWVSMFCDVRFVCFCVCSLVYVVWEIWCPLGRVLFRKIQFFEVSFSLVLFPVCSVCG